MRKRFIKAKSDNYIDANAIFEGGGIRGIGIVGALRCFEKRNYIWNRAGGTSVGAVIAALVVAGYTSKELEKILIDLDFVKFLDKDLVQKIPMVGTALGILKEKGMYSGDYFESWIRELLRKKGIVTFKDVMENGESRLKIVASDITRKKKIILPDDLIYYSIVPSEFEVAKAIRMSISIPFYFKPVEFRHKMGTSYIVDGGITCNYPIDIFDENICSVPIIGFKFNNKGFDNSFTSKGQVDTMSFLFDIAGTMTEYSRINTLGEKDMDRTVSIPVEGVSSTDFTISREQALKLFKSGCLAAEDFLSTWDFKEYVKKYRKRSDIRDRIEKIFSRKMCSEKKPIL